MQALAYLACRKYTARSTPDRQLQPKHPHHAMHPVVAYMLAAATAGKHLLHGE
jgi:hypothetical protein